MFLNMTRFISIFLVFGFAFIQLTLTLGAPFGEYVLGGKHRILPAKMRFVSGFFSVLWSLVGTAYLQKGGIIAPFFHVWFVDGLLIVYTLFLAFAIVGNGVITNSKKERDVMTPLSVIGFLRSVFVLVNS